MFKGNAGSQFVRLFRIIKVILHKAQIISSDQILYSIFLYKYHLDRS